MVENNLSQKERALIRMAANRLNENKYDTDRAWEKVHIRLGHGGRNNWKKIILRCIVICILLLSCGGIIWLYSVNNHSAAVVESLALCQGRGVPELILANGQRIWLDSSVFSGNMQQPGAIVKFDSACRQMEYQSNGGDFDSEIHYNTLNIPKGGEYALTLADGSRVWVNSESSFRFPVQFRPGCREVFLDGEAFFEVAPDKNSPFIIRMGQRRIEVVGTSFNISAYRTDDRWYTTLATGKVKVFSGRDSITLSSGEQYVENILTLKKEVRKVNVEQYCSWRLGRIEFKGERFEDIIHKLERWYDFKMFYANDAIKGMRFRGVINKYDSYEVVLRNLEQTADIRFDIKGSTVIARKIN